LRGEAPLLRAGSLWLPLMLCQVIANETVALSAAALRGLGDYRTGAIA